MWGASDCPKCHHYCLGRLLGQYHGLTMTTGAGGQSIERGVARLSPRATALLAWCLCAVSLTLTTLGLFLLVVSQSPAGGPASYLASVSGVVGDGLVEAHDPHREMFGFPRLRDLVGTDRSGGSSLIDFLLSELTHFTGEDWEQEDDITLVTLARSEEL
jgi:hypothetical protein